MSSRLGLLSIKTETRIIQYVGGYVVDEYSVSPDYQFIAVLLQPRTNYVGFGGLRLYYISPDTEYICISNNLIWHLNTINSFMWSGKWFIVSTSRNHYNTYLKFDTAIWVDAINTGKQFNPGDSMNCEIIRDSKSYLTDDAPAWISSINTLPAILDYESRELSNDKLLFFINTDTTYNIYYLSGRREYTKLCQPYNVVALDLLIRGTISTFSAVHHSSEIVPASDGQEYISNIYSAIISSMDGKVIVYTTNINVYADRTETVTIPKLMIPPVDDNNIIPIYIQPYPDDTTKIIIGYVQIAFNDISKKYIIIDLSTNTYENKEIPADLSSVVYYRSFNMAGPNTICMMAGPENNCVSYNLFTGERRILRQIDTVAGFSGRNTTYYKTTQGFGNIRFKTSYYRDVLDPDNWFQWRNKPINRITKASPDNSRVIVNYDDNSNLSIQYSAKYCAEYNHVILSSMLADELPAELISGIAKYSIC